MGCTPLRALRPKMAGASIQARARAEHAFRGHNS